MGVDGVHRATGIVCRVWVSANIPAGGQVTDRVTDSEVWRQLFFNAIDSFPRGQHQVRGGGDTHPSHPNDIVPFPFRLPSHLVQPSADRLSPKAFFLYGWSINFSSNPQWFLLGGPRTRLPNQPRLRWSFLMIVEGRLYTQCIDTQQKDSPNDEHDLAPILPGWRGRVARCIDALPDSLLFGSCSCVWLYEQE